MTRSRRALRPIAWLWVLWHAVTLPAASTVLWSLSADVSLECQCTHGGHAVCPMHHKPARGANVCQVQSAGGGTAVLVALFDAAAIVPVRMHGLLFATETSAFLVDLTTPSFISTPPEPPPPRS